MGKATVQLATTQIIEPSFTDLVPQKAARSSYQPLKSLDGQKVSIKDVGEESKGIYYIVLKNDERYGIPATLAKKIVDALRAAKAGNKEKGRAPSDSFNATVTALDRGVRLS